MMIGADLALRLGIAAALLISAAAAGALGGYHLRDLQAAADMAEVQADQAHRQRLASDAHASALRVALQRGAERTEALEKEAHEARTRAEAARRAAAVSADAARKLREHFPRLIAAVAADARGLDPAAAVGSEATTGPGLVLSNLLGGMDARGRECAAALDQSRIAGQACERSYDALRKPP